MSAVDLNDISIEELKKIKKDEQNKLKKECNEYKQQQEKQKLIADIMGIEKQRKRISKTKPRQTKPKKHTKTFEEYFQECIKNKTIPADTPPYRKKALKRALKEYQQGIKKRNQLWITLLKNILSMVNQVLFQFNILKTKPPR